MYRALLSISDLVRWTVIATVTVEPLRAPGPSMHARRTPMLPLCSQGCPDLYVGAEPQKDAAALLLTPE